MADDSLRTPRDGVRRPTRQDLLGPKPSAGNRRDVADPRRSRHTREAQVVAEGERPDLPEADLPGLPSAGRAWRSKHQVATLPMLRAGCASSSRSAAELEHKPTPFAERLEEREDSGAQAFGVEPGAAVVERARLRRWLQSSTMGRGDRSDRRRGGPGLGRALADSAGGRQALSLYRGTQHPRASPYGVCLLPRPHPP